MMKRAMIVIAVLMVLIAPASSFANTTPAPPPSIDGDTLPKNSTDANWTLRWLGSGKYELLVQNTSGIGYINSFDWSPPLGMTLTKVTSSPGGKCSVVQNDIACKAKLKPPKCTCLPGGSITIDFTAKSIDPKTAVATSYGAVGSYLVIKSLTPVPYHIPSELSGSSNPGADLPVCKKGQTSTKANPCTKK
jgi:hypothetical protein